MLNNDNNNVHEHANDLQHQYTYHKNHGAVRLKSLKYTKPYYVCIKDLSATCMIFSQLILPYKIIIRNNT